MISASYCSAILKLLLLSLISFLTDNMGMTLVPAALDYYKVWISLHTECFLVAKMKKPGWVGNFVNHEQCIFLKHAGLWAGTEAESSDSDQKLAELSASVARNLSLRSEYPS